MTDDEIRAHVEPFSSRIGGPIQALRRLMQEYGAIQDTFLPVLADVFNISRAEVRGIISFYADFNVHPAPHRIRICQAEACQALGSRGLTRELEVRYQTSLGNAVLDNASGGVALEAVYCLGLCAVGPAVEIDGRLIGRATSEMLEIGL